MGLFSGIIMSFVFRLFRTVHVPLFLNHFPFDRRHMKGPAGDWIAQPPAYYPYLLKESNADPESFMSLKHFSVQLKASHNVLLVMLTVELKLSHANKASHLFFILHQDFGWSQTKSWSTIVEHDKADIDDAIEAVTSWCC